MGEIGAQASVPAVMWDAVSSRTQGFPCAASVGSSLDVFQWRTVQGRDPSVVALDFDPQGPRRRLVGMLPRRYPPYQSGPAHGSCLPAKQGGARACHACIVFRRPSSQVEGLYALINGGWSRGQAGVERS